MDNVTIFEANAIPSQLCQKRKGVEFHIVCFTPCVCEDNAMEQIKYQALYEGHICIARNELGEIIMVSVQSTHPLEERER